MHATFAELARADTPMGVLTLRRRREPTRQVDVYEIKLDDELLMSSPFTVAEVELAGEDLQVVVGGLGLGYTARAPDSIRTRSASGSTRYWWTPTTHPIITSTPATRTSAPSRVSRDSCPS